ncbi:MAG TPA: TetR/AcrR family transcriptional regulator [Candidatus Competibacter phosphatis]|jgi:AcrR family transcriptional regulator|nr:TetR/AcrR family transcriptional regulator [Candidatus Competibacteraceae bacterium]MCP5353124.1 TetR/AcrR family transcriptional regulator [Chromatiales bacterium]MDG4562061.1 TetR/AcrR family transcriptional regulator [Candidatus Competibacter sp.]HMQ12418.1 TetR/AcrR family transcriptional regulator [Candidatus Competibacter phosphatis]HMR02295.1 TetR/AcrR family transcriptional regulator [Candidatus Competibacter phosphatis]
MIRSAAPKNSGKCRAWFSLESSDLPATSNVCKIVFTYLLKSKRLYSMITPAIHNTRPRQRLTTDQRQREIVATVLALARERGPDAITTQAIADRMGLTQGAIFRHFPDKLAIWLAVFGWVRESLGAAITAAIETVASPLAKIEQVFLAHVAFVVANPGVPRVLFHELQYPGDSPVRVEVRAMINAYHQRLTRLFMQAKVAGELPPALDPTLAPVLFVGAVQGLVIQASLAGDETQMVEGAAKLWQLLLDAYRGRGEW